MGSHSQTWLKQLTLPLFFPLSPIKDVKQLPWYHSACGQVTVTVFRFPDSSVGKESAYNAGDTRDSSSIPGSGRSSGEGHGNPLPVLPGESCGQRSLVGYSPWGHRVRHDWSDWAQHSITLIVFDNGIPKHKSSNSDTPKRIQIRPREVLKYILQVQREKRNTSSQCLRTSPQSSHITTTMVIQYNKVFWDRDHVHITFMIVYCYNCSVIAIVVNLLLCLSYKLNFIIDVYV